MDKPPARADHLRMTACLLYARYSTAMQSRASVEDQLRLLRQRADREEWTIAGEHFDHAISGTVLDRPGLNQALAAIDAGRAVVLLAESLDRISRDQEDLARIYKQVRFRAARIVTLSEGEVSAIHVGMGGTISAVMLEQLADKVRRGQIGRVDAGRIPGGISYGYRAVRTFDASGQPERGLREIDEAQASIVRRIFAEYAAGEGPLRIAARLNADGVPSPRGGLWRANAIVGHRQRRNGILNNELYRGRILYNRQTFRKDPETRKRVSRPNDADKLVSVEIPELRIVDEDLWHRVADRIDRYAAGPSHQARRPKRLLSGLMTCGECGGSYILAMPGRWACSNRRQTGSCTNGATLTDSAAQKRLWTALQANLLHPDVVAAYLDERRELLAAERRRRISAGASIERRLAELQIEDERISAAVLAGLPIETLKARAEAIAAERAQLRAEADDAGLEALAAAMVHPGAAESFRRDVARLNELADADEETRAKSRALLQRLVTKIEIQPRQNARGVDMIIHGDLAAILDLPQTQKSPAQGGASECMSTMVAGAGFEPATFRL